MLWLYVAAGGIGLLFGLCFRVPAIVAASAALAMAGLIIGSVAGWSAWTMLAAVFGGTFALQVGYLAGLLLMCAWSRIGSWSDMRERLIYNYRALLARAR